MSKNSNSGHHVVPASTYLAVFMALLILTIVTVSASRIDFGFMNTVIALGIATIKAILVMAIFMHLKYDGLLNRVIIAHSFFFLFILFLFSFVFDIALRLHWTPH